MTKRRQQPLLDPSGSELPSPLFTPRPGWGGQLAAWFKGNASVLLFRTVLVAAMAVVLISIMRRPSGRPELAATPTPEPVAQEAITETIAQGDTLTRVAGRALDRYLENTGKKLDAIQRLWAADRLTNATLTASPALSLKSGAAIDFPVTVIEYAINEAETLSAAQRASLQIYLK